MTEVYKKPENPLKQKFEALATKSDFNPAEKRHYDELVIEYIAILDNRTAEQMSKAGKVNELEAATAKLKKITDLVKKTHNLEIDLSEYSSGFLPEHVGQNVFFKINANGKRRLIDQDKKQIGGDYTDISEVADISGKIFFHAQVGAFTFAVINQAGKMLGGEFTYIGPLVDIDGKLYFKAQKPSNGKMVIIDEDGKEVCREYSIIQNLKKIGNDIVFRAKTEFNTVLVTLGGAEIAGSFTSHSDPDEVGGKAFMRIKNDSGKYVIVDLKGTEVSDEYHFIKDIIDVDGKMYLSVAEKKTNPDGTEGPEIMYIVNDKGEKVTNEYRRIIIGLRDVDGKYFFKAKKIDGGEWAVISIENGEEAEGFGWIGSVVNLDGDLIVGETDGSISWNFHDIARNRNLGTPDSIVKRGIVVAGMLMLVAEKTSGGMFVQNRDGDYISEQFKTIYDVYEVDGKVYVLGYRDDKYIKEQIYI